MISKGEHAAAHVDLSELANQYSVKTEEALKGLDTDLASLRAAKNLADEYHAKAKNLTLESLHTIGLNTASHYNKVLELHKDPAELDELVKNLISQQMSEPYHGANLADRLKMNRVQGMVRLTKSSKTGADIITRHRNLVRYFAQPYPHGAQVSYDTRILTGQAVLLEHQIAKSLGVEASKDFVVWTLSGKHSKRDLCDELAEAVDKSVEKALQAADINIPSDGVYFLNQVPNPPHPNCQCTLRFIAGGKVDTSTPTRPLATLRKLWAKLTKKRKRHAA